MSGPAFDGAAEPSLGRYEAICEHAELELEAMAARWEDLTGDLPPRPPAAAAPLLQRAQLIHERTRIELIRLREALLSDLATATRARRAGAGYAGQLRRRPRVDRSA